MKRFIALMLTVTCFLVSFSIAGFAKESIEVKLFQGEDITEVTTFKPNKMTQKEKDVYFKSIEKQVKKMKKQFGNNFDENKFRTELRFVLETENSFKLISENNSSEVSAQGGTWIPDIKIPNYIVSAALEVAVDVTLITLGVGSVAVLLKKYGASQARKIFTKTLYTKLTAWGATSLAGALPIAVSFILELLSPFDAIANLFDSWDYEPNNGYLDIYL